MTYMGSTICYGLVVTSHCWMATWTYYELTVWDTALLSSQWVSHEPRNPGPQANPKPFKCWNFEKGNRKMEKFNSKKGTFAFSFCFFIKHKSFRLKTWGNEGEKRKAFVLCPLEDKNNAQNPWLFIFHKKFKYKPVAYCISNGNTTVEVNFCL